MFELVPEAEPTPELWDCMKTCKHALEYPGKFWNGEPRCDYGLAKCGTSGKNVRQEVWNNTVHFWCVYYERNVNHESD